MQRDPARVAAHDLDDEGTVMAFRGGVQPVDRLHRDVDRGVEAEGVVGRAEVVVDRLGHADHRQAPGVQCRGDPEGVFAADRDQRVHAEPSQVGLDPLQAGPAARRRALRERVGPRRTQDRPTTRQDASHRLGVQRDRVAFQRPAPPVAEPEELVAVLWDSLPDQGADHGIQPWTVATTGQHSDSHGSNISRHECPRN